MLRSSEFVYATLALFALTQGPVLRLWSQSAVLAGELPNPSIPHVQFSTYVAVQLPALALLVRRISSQWLRERANIALFAFIGWLGATVMWSSFARHSLPEFVALTLTTAFGLYLAMSFSWKQLWWLIASAMALGVGISWVAIMRLWAGAVNFQEDYWVGIYYNRNSLAPVAAMSIIAAFALLLNGWATLKNSARAVTAITAVAASSLAVFAVIELWQSGSQTSPIALAIASLSSFSWLLSRTLLLKISFLKPVVPYAASIIIFITALVVFLALMKASGYRDFETVTTAFNQRSGLWALSWEGFLRKPWHGWGWMSAWHDPLFLLSSKEPSWMAWGLDWSHSGYFDLLLGGGIPAAGLFLTYIMASTQRLGAQSPQKTLVNLTTVVYVLSAATQESFFIGSHFLWALLVASLSSNSGTRKSVDKYDSSEAPLGV